MQNLPGITQAKKKKASGGTTGVAAAMAADPAGGAGWRGLAALLTRTGIRRVTYLLKASLTLPKAGTMFPVACPAVMWP